ncbi:MAG TPA: PaaI family thioesterase [Actinomycetota bacterium]
MAVDPADEPAEELRPLPSHYDHCFGCGREHPTGLHMRMEGGGREVRGRFTVTEHHQGAPMLAHGGVIAAAMDEGMGYLLWLLQHPAVTGHLEVDYRRPVPVGTELELHGVLEKVEGRKIYTRMTGTIDGKLAVEARAVYIKVGLEHFQPYLRDERFDNPYNP